MGRTSTERVRAPIRDTGSCVSPVAGVARRGAPGRGTSVIPCGPCDAELEGRSPAGRAAAIPALWTLARRSAV